MSNQLIKDTNPFIAEFECSNCGAIDKRVNEFPGSNCIACHAAKFENEPPHSASELAAMFGSNLIN